MANKNISTKEENAESSVNYRSNISPESKLRLLIKDRGFNSIAAFANSIGMSRCRVSQIINRIGKPPSDDLKIKIAEGLGVDSLVIWRCEYK